MRFTNVALFTAVVTLVSVMPAPAYAHVLIRDTTGSSGAVLHVTPDDDPVAGKPSGLYFSLQDQPKMKPRIALKITDSDSVSTSVPIENTSNGVSARYTFPTRGVYTITVTVDGAKRTTYVYAQRVSRGVGSDPTAASGLPLVRAGLIVLIVAFIALMAYAYGRRKQILAQSTF